jgi:hypothetical protein
MGDYSWGDASLTLCQDGSWCCGYENMTGCCYKNLGIRLDATGQIISTSTVSSLSSTSTPNSSTSQLPPTIPPTNSQNSSKNTTKIGVGVGVPLGIVVLTLSAIALFFYRRSKHTQNTTLNPTPVNTDVYPPKPELPAPFIAAPRSVAAELDSQREMGEHTRIVPAELAGNSRGSDLPGHRLV